MPAIRWPAYNIAFLGIDPPEHVVRREVLDAGESKRGYKAFAEDPYGTGTFLQDKRGVRGWRNGYRKLWDASMGGAVLELLTWSGGKSGKDRFPKELPWDEGSALCGSNE